MRALTLFSLFLLPISSLSLVVACSSSTPAASGGIDASAPQAIGAPCDPSSAEPCLPSGDVCTGIVCDPALHVCTQFDTDAGPPCAADLAPCMHTEDCDLGLTCGFPVGGGCTAQGQCINPPLPCENDAASCGNESAVCGCDGLPDPFVIPGYAIAPVASTVACPDGGPVFDGGQDSGSADASDAADANDSNDAGDAAGD